MSRQTSMFLLPQRSSRYNHRCTYHRVRTSNLKKILILSLIFFDEPRVMRPFHLLRWVYLFGILFAMCRPTASSHIIFLQITSIFLFDISIKQPRGGDSAQKQKLITNFSILGSILASVWSIIFIHYHCIKVKRGKISWRDDIREEIILPSFNKKFNKSIY